MSAPGSASQRSGSPAAQAEHIAASLSSLLQGLTQAGYVNDPALKTTSFDPAFLKVVSSLLLCPVLQGRTAVASRCELWVCDETACMLCVCRRQEGWVLQAPLAVATVMLKQTCVSRVSDASTTVYCLQSCLSAISIMSSSSTCLQPVPHVTVLKT